MMGAWMDVKERERKTREGEEGQEGDHQITTNFFLITVLSKPPITFLSFPLALIAVSYFPILKVYPEL